MRKSKLKSSIRKKKTFRNKIYKIIANDYRYNIDPYKTTDKVVLLVRKIIKDRIKEIDIARKEAEDRGDQQTAQLYRDIIYPINWMLEQKFDIIETKTEDFYP